MSDSEKPRTDLPYLDALHAVQTGVAYTLERDNRLAEPKHVRTGIDSAMINDAALVRLLVKKGLITEEEYAEEVRLETCREVDRYEDRLEQIYGAKVTLR